MELSFPNGERPLEISPEASFKVAGMVLSRRPEPRLP
jgi:hypothetical protein